MTKIQSLKNPTRILTLVMALCTIIYALGETQLSQMLPHAPTWLITILVVGAGYVVTQYGTEHRVVRAEDIKEQQVLSEVAVDDEYVGDS